MDTEKKQILIEEGLFTVPTSPDEKPKLIGVRCNKCGLAAFPKTPTCPRCQVPDTMEEALLDGKGKLDSFTIVNAALPGFKAPSIQAYIRLDDGPVFWSLITGVEPEESQLQLGMNVELVIGKVREDKDGNEIIGYQFKPTGN